MRRNQFPPQERSEAPYGAHRGPGADAGSQDREGKARRKRGAMEQSTAVAAAGRKFSAHDLRQRP